MGELDVMNGVLINNNPKLNLVFIFYFTQLNKCLMLSLSDPDNRCVCIAAKNFASS